MMHDTRSAGRQAPAVVVAGLGLTPAAGSARPETVVVQPDTTKRPTTTPASHRPRTKAPHTNGFTPRQIPADASLAQV